jgi:hypothetical protein
MTYTTRLARKTYILSYMHTDIHTYIYIYTYIPIYMYTHTSHHHTVGMGSGC